MSLISVIVPVYNVAPYLDRCVSSIVRQTYENLEIMLVDDGSSDSSGNLCDLWAANDARVCVIHKSNGGLSDARNAGMAVAVGEYVSFVDSDDWIDVRMYETCVRIAENSYKEIVECDWVKATDTTAINQDDIPKLTEFATVAALRELLNNGEIKQTVWNKLYRRTTIGDLHFPFGKTNEDEYWTYRVIANARCIVKVDATLYYYYDRPGSIMTSKYSVKRIDCLGAYEERWRFIKQAFPELATIASNSYLQGCFYQYQQLCLNYGIDPRGILRRGIMKRVRRECLIKNTGNMPMKKRAWLIVFCVLPSLTCRIRNWLRIGL